MAKRKIRTNVPIGSTMDEAQEIKLFGGLQELLEGKPKIKPRSTGRVQLEKAPNAIIFIESDKFLAGPTLHDPQYEVVRDFFELLCPVCNDIDSIRKYHNVPREDQILFEYDMCPKCGSAKEAFASELNHPNELIGVVGMRGGKSVVVACMSAYMIHELVCTDNLQERLGLVRTQEIDGAFVAASGEQATETIYGHFRGFYDSSPWFQDYKKKLMDLEILDPELRRGDLYRDSDLIIHFRDKHIRIRSMTSNSGSIAGRTRIFAVIDELSRLDAGESKRSAIEVYRVLKRSLITIKSAVDTLRSQGDFSIPDARIFCISSPMFQDDLSMQLLKEAKDNDKRFAFHRTTWEFNPSIKREHLAEEFETDPVGAERDYAANPPGAENPFVKNPNIIETCIDRERNSIFTTREVFFEQEINDIKFYYLKSALEHVRYANLIDYVIHCDPGQSGDSFCLAIGHINDDVVIIDGAIEVRPIRKNNIEKMQPRDVYFPAMKDLIIELSKKISVRYISYDRWNSTEQIQELRNNRILAFQKNITRDDHIRFLNTMMARQVSFPMREDNMVDPTRYRNMPCAKALHELQRLNDNGVKVDHPPNGSNDVIQCYVGVHRLLLHPEEVISLHDLKKNTRAANIFRKQGRKIGRVIKLSPRGAPR